MRAINLTCVTATRQPTINQSNPDNWPNGNNSDKANTTWRGGALPKEHLEFFEEGKMFRSNMFLATSFNLSTAHEFMNRASH